MKMNGIINEYKSFFKGMHKNILYYFGIVFFTTVLSAAYNVLFGIYMKNLGFNEAFVGRILSLQTLGVALGAVPIAIFAQHFNKKWTLIVGLLTMITSSFLILNLKTIFLVEAIAVIFGVGNATVMILQAPLVFNYTKENHRITAFSMAFVLQNLAMVLGSYVLGHLSQNLTTWIGPIKANWFVLNGTTLFACVSLLIALRIEEEILPSKKVSIQESFSSVFKGYKILLRGSPFKYLIQVALVGLGAGMIVPFFGMYLKFSLDISDGKVGTIMAISQMGTVIGGLVVPPLAKRLGRVRTVIACQLLSIPFLFSISFPQGIVIITISFFFRSSLMNMASPIIQSLAMEIVEDEQRTYMSGMVSLVNNLFRAIGIFMGGIVMYRFSYNTPYYFTIGCYLVGTYVLYKVFKGKKD